MIQETFLRVLKRVWIYCVKVCVCNEVVMTQTIMLYIYIIIILIVD